MFIKLFLLIENFLFWNHLDSCLLNCLFAMFFILFILQRDLVLYQLHCFLHSFIELFKQLSQLLQSEIVKIIWDNCDFGHYIFINKKICFFKFDFLITKRKLGRRLTKKNISSILTLSIAFSNILSFSMYCFPLKCNTSYRFRIIAFSDCLCDSW